MDNNGVTMKKSQSKCVSKEKMKKHESKEKKLIKQEKKAVNKLDKMHKAKY